MNELYFPEPLKPARVHELLLSYWSDSNNPKSVWVVLRQGEIIHWSVAKRGAIRAAEKYREPVTVCKASPK